VWPREASRACSSPRRPWERTSQHVSGAYAVGWVSTVNSCADSLGCVRTARLRARLEALAARYRRYGLPRLLVLLRREGVTDNHKRVGRVYRAAQLHVRKRLRRTLALGRGILPLLVAQPNLRWSRDFVQDRLRSGRRLRILTVVDEGTRKSLAAQTDFGFSSQRVRGAQPT
jgi:transposase InsO family protein